MSAKLRDLLYFVALLILLAVFSHVLTPFASIDIKVMAKFHEEKTINDRKYHGRVFYFAGRALTKRQETVEQWRGSLWNQGVLADEVYERAPVIYDEVYDEFGFPNKAGQDQYTIAFLGDSQTALSWPKEVGKALQVPVGNFGTPSLEPPFWRESLDAFVLPKKPKLVVIGLFNVRNRVNKMYYAGEVPAMPKSTLRQQIYWSKKYEIPLSLLDNPFGRMGVIALNRIKSARGTMKDLKPWRIFEQRVGKATGSVPSILQLGTTKHEFLPGPESLPFLYTPIREKYRLHMTQAVRQIRGRCALEGIQTIIVFIPSKESVYIPLIQKELNEQEQLKLLGVPADSLPGFEKYNDEALKLAKEIASKVGLPMLDGYEVLSEAVQAGKHPWFVTDSHLSREGCVIFGAAVGQFIKSLGLPKVLKRSRVTMGPAPALSVQKNEVELSVEPLKQGREIWLELDVEAKKASDVLVTGAQGSETFRPVGGRMRTTYFLRYDMLATEEDRGLRISGLKRGTLIHTARIFVVH